MRQGMVDCFHIGKVLGYVDPSYDVNCEVPKSGDDRDYKDLMFACMIH